MSAELLYQRSKGAMEAVAQARVQAIIDGTVDAHQGRIENMGLVYVQHKAFIDGVVAATRALTDEYRKLTNPEEAQKAPPEERGPAY